MKKNFVRCLSALLSIIMLCSALPLSVFAETTFEPTLPGDVDPNHPTTTTTISVTLEEDITYDGKPAPVNVKTGVLALRHGDKTTGLSASVVHASGDYPEKYEYRYVWFYAPVYSADEALKYSYEYMTPLGEDMYGGWSKIAGEFSTLSDYADWFLQNAESNGHVGYSPYFPDLTYEDILGEYWEKYMGGANALAIACLVILVDASTQTAVACAATGNDNNACVTLGGGNKVKITRVGDEYEGDSTYLRYGSFEDTVPLVATTSGLEGTLTYQWYRYDDTTSPATTTPINGATSATFDAPVPYKKNGELRYTCGVTAGGETYFPDKAYTITRSGSANYQDLSDTAYTSAMESGGVAVYMDYSFIHWLIQSSDDAYMSIEYYSVPSKDSYANATLLCRREPFKCVKVDPTGNTGYLDSYTFPLELGETKYIYAVIYYHGNSADGEIDMYHSARTNICAKTRARTLEMNFSGFLRPYGDWAYQGAQTSGLTQRIGSTTSFIYPSVRPSSSMDDLGLKTLVDRFTIRVYATDTDVREGGTLLAEKSYTHEELQSTDIWQLVNNDFNEIQPPSETAGVSYIYGAWEAEIDGVISKGVSKDSFKVVTEGTAEDMFVFENGKIMAYKGAEADVIIPSTIGGVRVTEITAMSIRPEGVGTQYSHCDDMYRKVVIPEGVTTIGKDAFRQQESLEEVVLPSTLTWIGDSAFAWCTSLKKIDLSGITGHLYIRGYAFYSCKSVTELIFPESESAMAEMSQDIWGDPGQGYQFVGLARAITIKNLKQADYGTHTNHDMACFKYGNTSSSLFHATGTDAVFIPSEDAQFMYYYHPDKDAYSIAYFMNLKPEHFSIENYEAVLNRTGDAQIVIKNLPTTFNGKPVIGVGSPYTGIVVNSSIYFVGYEKATHYHVCKVELNDVYTYIGEYAFMNVDHVKLPHALKSVGQYAFYRDDMDRVTIDGFDNVPFLSEIGNCAFHAYLGDSLKNLVFEHDVRIGDFAFMQPLYELKNVDDGDMFGNYIDHLETLTFRGNAIIGAGAFSEHLTLKTVEFGEGKTVSLGQDAFDRCFNIETVKNLVYSDIINGSQVERERGFSHFRWTKAFPDVVDTGNAIRYIREGNWCISGASGDKKQYTHDFYTGYLDNDIVLPGTVGAYSVYRISGDVMLYHNGDGRDWSCDGVEYKLTIGEGITTMSRTTTVYNGAAPYRNCVELILPSSMTVITENLFMGCAIRKLTLPSKLTRIEEGAFSGCPIEGELEIPATVTEIGAHAFSMSKITTLKLHEGLKTIGYGNFYQDPSLTRIISVGKNDHDADLQTFPDSLVSIGGGCFNNINSSVDGGLTGTLVLPAGLQTVGIDSFCYHNNLKKVIAYCGEFQGYCNGVAVLNDYYSGTGSGWGAFQYCPNLEEVDLSQSMVTYLPDGFLFACPKLKTLQLPITLKIISSDALGTYEAEERIDAGIFILPDGLQVYRAYTSGSLTLPESVVTVHETIFNTHSVITFLNRDKTILTTGSRSSGGYIGVALPTSIPDTCLIRCYKDSFIYNWCVTNSINYELIENNVEATLTAAVKTMDGTPLSGFASIRWVDTTTGREVWVNNMSYNVPTELAGHIFECIITLTAAQLDNYQSQPTIIFTYDTSVANYETSRSIALGTRTRVTIVGTFPQYNIPGFTARLVNSTYGIDREIVAGADGRFEMTGILRADDYHILLDVVSDGERIYKQCDVKVSLYAAVNADGVLPLGELSMSLVDPMLSLPVYNDNLQGLSMTLVRRSDGTEFRAYYDSYRQAISISDSERLLKCGDEVILRCGLSSWSRRYFEDISFTLPGEFADDFIMSIDIKQLPYLSCSQRNVSMLIWDADGRLVAYGVSGICLVPGTYTVIGMDYHWLNQINEIDIASLESFRALGLPADAQAEQSITIAYGTDATFDAEVKMLGYINNRSTNTRVIIYDAAGKYVGVAGYAGKCSLMPGYYTLIGISSSALIDVPQTLQAFEALGFSTDCFVKKELRVELGGEYVFEEKVTPVIGGVRFLVTMDMNHMDALGRVPVCINYKKVANSARFPLSFTIVSSGTSLGIVNLGGDKYATIDSSLGLQNMGLTIGAVGYNTIGTLTFTSEAEEGNIWFYVLANGGTYNIDVGSTTITTLQPQQKKFSVTAPAEVTNNTKGMLYLDAQYSGKLVKAELYVDDELQSTNTLRGTGMPHAIRYTIKAYDDGYSEHTIQLVCYDDETDEFLWSSDIYTVKHTNNPVAEPERLNIELINYNEHAVKKESTINLRSGNTSYPRITIIAVPSNFSNDGTWKRDVTLNFSLEATNPTGLKDVSIRLWCNESAPYRRNVPMVYNEMTGCFEGSATWSGGTFTSQDLPYGLDVLYTQRQTTVTEEYSLTAMLDKVTKMHEERSTWQKKDEERRELMQPVDLDQLVMSINNFNTQDPENAFDEEEMEIVTSLMSAWNDLCDAYKELDAATEEWAVGFSSTGDPYGDINDILAFCNGTTGTMASVSLEGITTQQLLDNGFVTYEYSDRTMYVHKNGVVADTELNVLIYSDPANIPGDLYAELFSARMARMGLSRGRDPEEEIHEGVVNGELSLLRSYAFDGTIKMITFTSDFLDSLFDFADKLEPDSLSVKQATAKFVKAEENMKYRVAVYKAEKVISHNFSKKVDATQTVFYSEKILESYDNIMTQAEYNEMKKASKPVLEARAELKVAKANLEEAQRLWKSSTVAQNRARMRAIKANMSKFKSFMHVSTIAKHFSSIGKAWSLACMTCDTVMVFLKVLDAENSIKEKYEYLESLDYFDKLYRAYEAGCLKGVSTYDQWRDFIFDVDKAASEAAKLIRNLDSMYDERLQVDVESVFMSAFSYVLALFPGQVIKGVSVAIDIANPVLSGIWAAIKDGQIEDATDEFWEQINVIRDALARIDRKCMNGDDPDKDPDGSDPDGSDSDGSDFDGRSGPEYPNLLSPALDPAGFVYEAVYSNRVAGLTAKVFYKGEDGEPVFWEEAALYGEVNPQITDEYGQFAWMTTLGEWLVVIYDADGNPIADSRNDPAAVDGWLPVPPPQMKVYIGITSDMAPTVSAAGASTGKVQVTFDQYMDIGYILSNPTLVCVMQDGERVEVDISFSDQEERPAADGVFYGRVMVLTRKDGKAFSGDNIRVTVGGGVKNYAGTAMGTDYDSGAMTATQVAKTLEHSYPNRLVVKQGVTETIALRVIDENGLTMAGVTVTASASVDGVLTFESLTGVTDANGRVTFKLTGVAAGDTVLSFTTDSGVSCEMNARTVTEPAEKPQKPTSNIDDYMIVPAGTVLTFSCATPDAVIYYTTDNTCPCSDSSERYIYTGEITLTQSGFYRVAAYTEAGGYSERLNIHVIVVNYGDVNGDNIIDSLDVASLRKYLAGADIELAPGADTNGDGVVDATDLARLRQYLTGASSVMAHAVAQ